jgi:carbon monoxide dehydrogenase subunit G
MEFRGRYTLPARPDMVWAALHDPQVLAACIPGCEGVTQLSATEYRAQATLRIGPVKARFTGKVTWTDHAAPEGFTHAGTLLGEGQGGAAGFARGESQVRVAPGPDTETSVLTYEAKATVGGKLAQIGQRLIDAAAKAVADEFFAKFAALIRSGTTEAPVDAPPAPSPVPATRQGAAEGATGSPAARVQTTAQRRRGADDVGLQSQIWLVGLIGIVLILIFFFTLVL